MSEPTDDPRCASVHWSLPVQCVLPSTHAENWHEAWHPETGNRMRYRYPSRRTEELHHDEWHTVDLAISAERAHAYKMGGTGRESLVDALAKQLHHNESLHLHTLPGDEGDACRYCYLRAGRSVGALAPVVPSLIGPLTAEEWCSLRLGGLEDDPLYCCTVTSSMRDFLFEVLRMGADHGEWSGAVREAFGELDVRCEVKHPLIEKVRAYYFGEVSHA